MWPNPQFPADLVKFTENILNGKLQFLCSFSVQSRRSVPGKKKIKTKDTSCFFLMKVLQIPGANKNRLQYNYKNVVNGTKHG